MIAEIIELMRKAKEYFLLNANNNIEIKRFIIKTAGTTTKTPIPILGSGLSHLTKNQIKIKSRNINTKTCCQSFIIRKFYTS